MNQFLSNKLKLTFIENLEFPLNKMITRKIKFSENTARFQNKNFDHNLKYFVIFFFSLHFCFYKNCFKVNWKKVTMI